jgi:hypothetical protein
MSQWPVIVQSPTLIFEDEDEEEYEDDFEGRSYGFHKLKPEERSLVEPRSGGLGEGRSDGAGGLMERWPRESRIYAR